MYRDQLEQSLKGWYGGQRSTLTIPENPDSHRLCSVLIQAADNALYTAKKGGRNRVEKQLIGEAEPAPDYGEDSESSIA